MYYHKTTLSLSMEDMSKFAVLRSFLRRGSLALGGGVSGGAGGSSRSSWGGCRETRVVTSIRQLEKRNRERDAVTAHRRNLYTDARRGVLFFSSVHFTFFHSH